jgi:hypothetical protein
MTNENPVTEETIASKIDELKTKVRQLPWKKIAITAAVTTVAAIAVANREKLCGSQAYELEIHEVTPEGELDVHMTPAND